MRYAAYLGLALVVWLLAEQPQATTRTFEGTIDYTGTLPERPIHGYEYYLVDGDVRVRLWETDALTYAYLNPGLEGKRVRISGTFIEEFTQYRIERGELIASDPQGGVILVEGLDVVAQTIETEKSSAPVTLYLHIM